MRVETRSWSLEYCRAALQERPVIDLLFNFSRTGINALIVFVEFCVVEVAVVGVIYFGTLAWRSFGAFLCGRC